MGNEASQMCQACDCSYKNDNGLIVMRSSNAEAQDVSLASLSYTTSPETPMRKKPLGITINTKAVSIPSTPTTPGIRSHSSCDSSSPGSYFSIEPNTPFHHRSDGGDEDFEAGTPPQDYSSHRSPLSSSPMSHDGVSGSNRHRKHQGDDDAKLDEHAGSESWRPDMAGKRSKTLSKLLKEERLYVCPHCKSINKPNARQTCDTCLRFYKLSDASKEESARLVRSVLRSKVEAIPSLPIKNRVHLMSSTISPSSGPCEPLKSKGEVYIPS